MSLAIERTLVLIKPDAYAQTDEIEKRYHNAGLRITAEKTVIATPTQIAAHYQEHEGKSFYQGTVDFMLSGPVYAMVIEGSDAIQRVRDINGPTDPTKANPGDIRFDFGGRKMPANAVHASDSIESAKREIVLWFPEADSKLPSAS